MSPAKPALYRQYRGHKIQVFVEPVGFSFKITGPHWFEVRPIDSLGSVDAYCKQVINKSIENFKKLENEIKNDR